MTDKKLTPPLTTDISDENKDKKFNFSRMPYYVETPVRELDNDEFKQIKSDIEEINEARCLRLSENSIIVLTYYLYSKNYKKCDALAEYYERQAQKEKNEEVQRLQKDLKNQEIDHYQKLLYI